MHQYLWLFTVIENNRSKIINHTNNVLNKNQKKQKKFVKKNKLKTKQTTHKKKKNKYDIKIYKQNHPHYKFFFCVHHPSKLTGISFCPYLFEKNPKKNTTFIKNIKRHE